MSRQQAGRIANRNGKEFERLLDGVFDQLAALKIARIEKTPEPYKYVKPYGTGTGLFIGCHHKQAQPDYKGTLAGGRAVVLEAKSVSTGKIALSALTDKEYEDLVAYKDMGAVAGVLVWDKVTSDVYFFPVQEFERMSRTGEKKHIKLDSCWSACLTQVAVTEWFKSIVYNCDLNGCVSK